MPRSDDTRISRRRARRQVTVEIRLSGRAAAEGQTLVAELIWLGIDVRPLNDDDQDRSAETLLTDYGLALAAEASYGAVRDLVSRWATKRKLDPGEIDVPPAENAPADGPGTNAAVADEQAK